MNEKVNAVIRDIETDDITHTNKSAMITVLWVASWSVERQKRRDKRAMMEKKELKVILLTWEVKDKEKLEGKEREKLRNWLLKDHSRGRLQRRRKLKDMNKGFQNLSKTNYFKSTRNK